MFDFKNPFYPLYGIFNICFAYIKTFCDRRIPRHFCNTCDTPVNIWTRSVLCGGFNGPKRHKEKNNQKTISKTFLQNFFLFIRLDFDVK
jgi:hypothetical protein